MIAGLKKKVGDPELVELGIHCDTWRLPYDDILKDLSLLRVNNEDAWFEALAGLCEADFFMFCLLILGLPVNDPFLLARCYEVQDHELENCLWLWARDHWKSTLITYARTLWRICRIPNNRVALFSNSLKLARPRFKQMKNEMESNMLLKLCWPDVFWKNPDKDAITWSLDDGLFLKQNKMPWPSLGCYGLIDSMPTGGHFNEKIIDDLVDLKNIGTQFMMEKVKDAYEMSDNLGAGASTIENVIGTRYRYGDLYEYITSLKLHRVSLIAGEVGADGSPLYGGKPVLLPKETLDKKKIKQASTYYAQILQTPLEMGASAFKVDDLRFYENLPSEPLRFYIMVDPGTNPDLSTMKDLDFTAMWLIATGRGRRIYVVDLVRDHIGLKEKWAQLKDWHSRYQIDTCGYEEFATQKDREFFFIKMEDERIYFQITKLDGNKTEKNEKIGQLAEFFAEHRIYFPKNMFKLTKKRGVVDLVSEFINDEYSKWPLIRHDDMLDALARLADPKMNITYPEGEAEKEEPVYYDRPSPLDDNYDNLECVWGDL